MTKSPLFARGFPQGTNTIRKQYPFMKQLEKYSLGMGDRFAHQGKAQLGAIIEAAAQGINLVPVCNKSNREHTIIGSLPENIRSEADAAVMALNWKGSYYVDADHIGLGNVDGFLEACDFFTLDVADFTGKSTSSDEIAQFVREEEKWIGPLDVPGLSQPLQITRETMELAATKFLLAMKQAGEIHRHIRDNKKNGDAIIEVSVDETDTPQSPVELFLILLMLSREKVPVQTIAPKFTGRFNKGVEYAGDITKFEQEFDADLCIVAFAIRKFGLPSNLKLSVHSGSDKFSLYPILNRLVKKHGAGLHVKTAGTTWLEEVIGLAEAGGSALALAKEIYAGAFAHFEELTTPYATVLDIDRTKLPTPDLVEAWSSGEFTSALRHDQKNPAYNPHFRQLVHVAFKVAAKMGPRYTSALVANREIIAHNVKTNLLRRHILPIFEGL